MSKTKGFILETILILYLLDFMLIRPGCRYPKAASPPQLPPRAVPGRNVQYATKLCTVQSKQRLLCFTASDDALAFVYPELWLPSSAVSVQWRTRTGSVTTGSQLTRW